MRPNSKAVIIIFFLALFGGAYFLVTQLSVNDAPELPEEMETENIRETPTFSWRFEEAETTNLDGNHQTHIFLTAVYSETRRVDKLVDTVDGGCSELEGEAYEGDISNTGRVQCYYAGLGQNYRITSSEEGYRVERMFTEEALPNTVPPEYAWEVIAAF